MTLRMDLLDVLKVEQCRSFHVSVLHLSIFESFTFKKCQPKLVGVLLFHFGNFCGPAKRPITHMSDDVTLPFYPAQVFFFSINFDYL
jgi:hypothetical protein